MRYYPQIKLNRFVLKQVEKKIDFKVQTWFLGFTSKQLQKLYTRFQELDKRSPRSGYLTREDLMGIRKVALNPLGERLIDVIVADYGKRVYLMKFD